MENIAYVGLSQQMALQREMELTANNLANMNTPGFKAQNMLFLEYLNRSPSGDTVRQVMDYASYRNLAQGTLNQTFNKLDLAIQGEGFFVVQTPDGPRYTRDGGFALNNKNEVVNKSGFPLMSEGSAPITIQADAADITITPAGEIATEQGTVGRIKLVTFNNLQDLKPVGDNMFEGVQIQEKPVENPNIAQGMIENSNVNPIIEMNRMIEVLRAYQAAQKMLVSDHERIRSAIQKLSKV